MLARIVVLVMLGAMLLASPAQASGIRTPTEATELYALQEYDVVGTATCSHVATRRWVCLLGGYERPGWLTAVSIRVRIAKHGSHWTATTIYYRYR